MRLDLSFLPVPAVVPVVPVKQKQEREPVGVAGTIVNEDFPVSVPVVPVVPVHIDKEPRESLQPVEEFTAAIVTAIATGRALPEVANRKPAEPVMHGSESTEHNCHLCPHWQGVNCYGKGECTAGFRPWRISNIPNEPAFYRWHFIGQCAEDREEMSQ